MVAGKTEMILVKTCWITCQLSVLRSMRRAKPGAGLWKREISLGQSQSDYRLQTRRFNLATNMIYVLAFHSLSFYLYCIALVLADDWNELPRSPILIQSSQQGPVWPGHDMTGWWRRSTSAPAWGPSPALHWTCKCLGRRWSDCRTWSARPAAPPPRAWWEPRSPWCWHWGRRPGDGSWTRVWREVARWHGNLAWTSWQGCARLELFRPRVQQQTEPFSGSKKNGWRENELMITFDHRCGDYDDFFEGDERPGPDY